ncbi:unnamed protein product [Medioppia subpectinata]|uniref:Terpene synthase n=1 Tax=Medioppia subpectinata TaxID=1979941 RepID=A0A7R9LCI2_9ACAR|nr:unnamed protein product [Medioppia subpectinata]CAG2117623.1 unnamed protein product [Medioppia subpectinata]
MPNVLTKLAPKVNMIESMPEEFKNKDYSNARHISGLTHEMLMSFEIRGIVEEKIVRIPHHTNTLADTNLMLSEAFGKPVVDSVDITGFQEMCFKTKNALYFYTINYWAIFAFMLDDYLDQVMVSDGEGRHVICEWQKKYLLGESDGTTGFDKMLVKAMKLTKAMLTSDQFVRHVMYGVGWIGTYLTANQTKFNNKLMTYEEYWYQRERDCAADLIYIFMEQCDNLDVVKYSLMDNPVYIAFYKSAAKHSIIVNDIYSVKSEVLKDQGKYSYLYLLMAHQGWNCQQAVDQMVAEVHYQWYACINYGSQLVEYGIPELTEYVHEVMHEVRGNLWWSSIFKKNYWSDARHISSLTHEMLISFEIPGLVGE